jgi:uncharacterized protein
MFSRVRPTLLAAAVTLLAVAPAFALTPQVKDDAHFFSAGAVDKADQVIQEIKDRYHKDLLIETVKTAPDERADKVKHMDRSERERFFADWARERARREGINGVYVLICKDPGHVQVEVGNETKQKAFTTEDRDQLRDLFVRAFKANEHDKGLLDGVAYVRDTMKENLRERGGAYAGGPVIGVPPGGGGGLHLGSWVLGLLCLGVVGLLIVVALIRWLGRAGPGYGSGGYGPGGGYAGPAPGYGGYGGGGGGFLSSLFGGLFGAAAGNWVYDRFFRGSSSNYGDGGWNAGAPASSRPDTSDRPDTDYSGAGGDFDSGGSSGGDTGGGGELGSGDFYGGDGDTGGGDFGGGGGDSGGGGDF